MYLSPLLLLLLQLLVQCDAIGSDMYVYIMLVQLNAHQRTWHIILSHPPHIEAQFILYCITYACIHYKAHIYTHIYTQKAPINCALNLCANKFDLPPERWATSKEEFEAFAKGMVLVCWSDGVIDRKIWECCSLIPFPYHKTTIWRWFKPVHPPDRMWTRCSCRLGGQYSRPTERWVAMDG